MLATGSWTVFRIKKKKKKNHMSTILAQASCNHSALEEYRFARVLKR
jgi:hypothetical protein